MGLVLMPVPMGLSEAFGPLPQDPLDTCGPRVLRAGAPVGGRVRRHFWSGACTSTCRVVVHVGAEATRFASC